MCVGVVVFLSLVRSSAPRFPVRSPAAPPAVRLPVCSSATLFLRRPPLLPPFPSVSLFHNPPPGAFAGGVEFCPNPPSGALGKLLAPSLSPCCLHSSLLLPPSSSGRLAFSRPPPRLLSVCLSARLLRVSLPPSRPFPPLPSFTTPLPAPSQGGLSSAPTPLVGLPGGVVGSLPFPSCPLLLLLLPP